MKIIQRLSVHCSDEHMEVPAAIEVDLSPKDIANISAGYEFLVSHHAKIVVFALDGAFECQNCENGTPYEMRYALASPELRILGTGEVKFYVELKHSADEIWCSLGFHDQVVQFIDTKI